jgi:hypothetical protein
MIDIYPVIFKAVPYSKYYKPRPMGANSLSHLQINLRIFFKWAYANEFTQYHSFMLFDIKSPQYGTPYYLTIEERDHLLDFVFPDGQFKEKYEMERDTFIFQCLVGCRISDERPFTKDNINNGYLEYIPIKTRQTNHSMEIRRCDIPFHDRQTDKSSEDDCQGKHHLTNNPFGTLRTGRAEGRTSPPLQLCRYVGHP